MNNSARSNQRPVSNRRKRRSRLTFTIAIGAIFVIMIVGTISSPVISRESDLGLPAGETPFVANQLIIQTSSDLAASRLESEFAGYELRPIRQLSRRMNIWLYEYSTPNLKMSEQGTVLEAIRRSRDVELAQFNHLVAQRQTLPNDPSFSQQWGLHNIGQSGGTVDADIDAPEAWDVIKGDTTIQGDQIVVAIIDGGCDLNHNDIDYFKNLNETPGNGIDDDGNGYIDDYDGWNAYNNSGNVTSDTHGTHVAGIAAATGNNSLGVSGVNWGVKVMPINGSSTNEATVVAAYSYVHEMRSAYNETGGAYGAFVVSTNASFGIDYGDPNSYPIWCGIYDSMGAVGVLNAGATANLGIDIDVQGDVPTACPSDYMISVTNTTRYDNRNSGAAYGATTIDIGAPGTSIYSTLPGSTYGTLTGTSMATPHVCGAVGFLYSAACPTMLNDLQTDPAAVALYVKNALLNGVDTLPALLGSTVSGGRLNLYNSLQIILNYPCGLAIQHTPLTNTKDDVNPIEVIADITAPVAIDPDSALVFYSINGGGYASVLMSDYGGGEFHGFIPAQSPGTEIDYYIYAVDIDGGSNITDVFSFRVIDYAVIVSPAADAAFSAAEDTAMYIVTVTNDGILTDNFDLAYSGNLWSVSLWEAGGAYEISSTGSMLPDETVDVLVKVAVPASYYGDKDSVEVLATSQGDASYSAAASLVTTSVGIPLNIPVADEVSSTTLDPVIWQLVSSGVLVNDIAIDEPTPPYSINFNGTPGADTIVSMVVQLAGKSGVMVRYSYEQTGGGESPDSNDDLFIEYRDSLGIWQLINQHLGADPDMTSFVTVEYPLPGNAYHNNFQLRIRNVATTGPYDDWFVDDVFIGTPFICGDIDGDGEGPNIADLTYFVDYLFGGGPPPPVLEAADVDGIAGIDIADLTYFVDYLFAGGSAPICN